MNLFSFAINHFIFVLNAHIHVRVSPDYSMLFLSVSAPCTLLPTQRWKTIHGMYVYREELTFTWNVNMQHTHAFKFILSVWIDTVDYRLSVCMFFVALLLRFLLLWLSLMETSLIRFIRGQQFGSKWKINTHHQK